MGTQFQVRLSRNPMRFSTEDTESVRDWLLSHIEDLVHAGKLEPAVRFIGEDWYEDALVGHVLELGHRRLLAAFYLRALLRPDVREGYIITTSGENAVALSWSNEGEWWLAQRSHAEGKFTGPWLIENGRGIESLPDDLASWLDPKGAEVESLHEERRVPDSPDPDIRAAILPKRGPWPDDLSDLCEQIAVPLEAEVMLKGLDHFKVIAMRTDSLEQWEVRGDLPCSVADFVRAVALQGPVVAMAVMHAGMVNHEGLAERAILTTIERDGKRGTRVLVYEEEDGRLSADRIFFEPRQDPGENGWIGIEPAVDPGLRPLGTMTMGLNEPGEA